MSSQPPGEDEDPFADLFRREPELAEPDAPDGPDPVDEVQSVAVADELADGHDEHKEPTGRLFRSTTADGEAIPALRSEQLGRLRTVGGPAEPPRSEPLISEPPRVEPVLAEPAVIVIDDADARREDWYEVEAEAPSERRRKDRRRPAGLTPLGVVIVMLGVTLLVGAANAILHAPGTYSLGWPTGLALVLVTAYAAWAVRAASRALPVVLPPLAFGLAAITVGQIGLVPPGSTIVKRVVDTFFMLGASWYWMVGAIVVALAIAIARAFRLRD